MDNFMNSLYKKKSQHLTIYSNQSINKRKSINSMFFIKCASNKSIYRNMIKIDDEFGNTIIKTQIDEFFLQACPTFCQIFQGLY